MTKTLRQSARIVGNYRGWQRSIACRIITKSLMILTLVFTLPAHAGTAITTDTGNQILSGTAIPCSFHRGVRPDAQVTRKAAGRMQRPAATLSQTSAMALALAFGLRSATGPVVAADHERPARTMAKTYPSGNKATASSSRGGGLPLARPHRPDGCAAVSLMDRRSFRQAID